MFFVSSLPVVFRVVSAFAVLLAAVYGQSHLGSYGSARELKGAGACGDDNGVERGCARTSKSERKEAVVIQTVLRTSVRTAWRFAEKKVFCV